MSLAVVYSRANVGIFSQLVEVEVHLSGGLPRFNIVGLPEAAVKESKDRVRSAILNSHFAFPAKKITVNLAPADLPKEGGRYDLAIALGILAASKQISSDQLNGYEFGGELGLSGELRDFLGALPMAIAAQKTGRAIILPRETAAQCAIVADAKTFAAEHLTQVCEHLIGQTPLVPIIAKKSSTARFQYPDLLEVKGQYRAKRALEIAASGGHSLMMIGAPGAGKTMLANRLPGILPDLTPQESQEVACIYSLHHDSHQSKVDMRHRPFRNPHHSASAVSLIGGGRNPKPGEISLAHHGVLFLDELPEFNRAGLETLREPLESGCVTISRAAYSVEYPAKFQLIAAMNPCPCGYASENSGRCDCAPEQVKRYQKKISGPLLDRIDLQVKMSPVGSEFLLQQDFSQNESSATVRKRVEKARERQLQRNHCLNAELTNSLINQHCQLTKEDQQYLQSAIEQFKLSARSFHRVLKVARTIADLAAVDAINRDHLQEALLLRRVV